MSNPSMLDHDRATGLDSQTANEPNESFGDILSQYEQSHSHKPEEGRGLEGTVIAVTGESVFVDIGYKTEGILPLAVFQAAGESVKAGDKIGVSIKGRDPEGYYELSRIKVERPKDWTSLEKAFADKAAIAGTVSAVVKGGLSVDVGVRAFMPASRSGAKDAAEMEKLIGQEIQCRIIKLDVADEDVVVDRRVILEEEERAAKERRYTEVKEGETVHGIVRSLTDYGAFVDIGGVDALLHVADISWGRVNKPADVLTVGQEVEARVLKVDPAKRRISLGMKQLHAERNALLGGIDFQDARLDLLADGKYVGGLVDASPGDIRDMQQRVHAADIDEGAVIGQAAHRPVDRLALFDFGVAALFNGALFLFEHGAAVHDHVFIRHVELD